MCACGAPQKTMVIFSLYFASMWIFEAFLIMVSIPWTGHRIMQFFSCIPAWINLLCVSVYNS